MKKWLLILGAALAIALVTAGTARANDDPDEICIVFDHPYSEQNCAHAYLYVVSAYIVLMNPSAPVGGFEFMLCNADGSTFPPAADVVVLDYGMPYPYIAIVPPPRFVVQLPTPLPPDPVVMLAQIQMLPLTPTPWCFGLQPYQPSSLPGQMVYVDGNDPSHLIPLLPCTGNPDDSCRMACLNDPDCPPGPPVDTDPVTWDALKSLFR